MLHTVVLQAIAILSIIGSLQLNCAQAQRLQDCRTSAGPGQVRRCDEEASRLAIIGSQSTQLSDGWQLVKTKDPRSDAQTISIMHIADISKSDTNLAGLNIRCGPDGIQVVLIVIERLPRSSSLSVILKTEADRAEFDASVIQGGEALLLPRAASDLAAGEWKNASELAIEIATKPDPIRGVVPIRGLAPALRLLPPSCGTR